jgi:hypothetical protein
MYIHTYGKYMGILFCAITVFSIQDREKKAEYLTIIEKLNCINVRITEKTVL